MAPTDVAVLDPTGTDQLTLTTCNPRYSASQRLVVVADFDPAGRPGPRRPTRPEPSAPRPRPDLQPSERGPARRGRWWRRPPAGRWSWPSWCWRRRARRGRAGLAMAGGGAVPARRWWPPAPFYAALSLALPASY